MACRAVALAKAGAPVSDPACTPFAKIRAIRVKVFSPSVFICVHLWFKLGSNWVQIGFEMALFGFKWVRFLSSKLPFHIGKIRRFLHFKIGFVS